MDVLPESLRRRLDAERVARLATVSADGPALVPICFVLRAGTLYHVLDAKPKRVDPSSLRRVRNLRRDPRAAVIVDHYEEAWDRLWFVALEGTARLLTEGGEHERALKALKRKYPQYRRMPFRAPVIVIALDVRAVRRWQATPRPVRSGGLLAGGGAGRGAADALFPGGAAAADVRLHSGGITRARPENPFASPSK